MTKRIVSFALCGIVLAGAAWLGRAQNGVPVDGWAEVAPGVWRSPGLVAGYALVEGDMALLIDAPQPTDGLAKLGVRAIDRAVLTHYHRDVCAALPSLKCPVRAPKGAEEWLSPDGVAKYWKESLPLRSSRTAYMVLPAGVAGIDCTLADGFALEWRGWKIHIIETPGSARAQVAVVARKGEQGPRVVFCGGAFASSGKLALPFSTDWDHWTDAGLKPTAASLRKLIDAKADVLCPAHGPVLSEGIDAALKQTLAHVEEVGFLRSFERFTKQRLGNPPQYRFIAKEQAESNGSKPWSRISEHLWLTGNTYVLTSKDGGSLMIDPWDQRCADQWRKLRADQKLAPLEVVMFSHAHFDHYDGIHYLPEKDAVQVWALDLVAKPIADPFQLRAPFLDARPIKFHQRPRDGETLAWREYRFRFHHLPGQSEFTMGVEASIDGKRCFFTADNFFHQDMFSGSGGWMGLNRSFPPLYARSAKKVLDAAPEWVLAEHGGPFEFNAEDFRRRVQWGEVSAKAADALSPTGAHLHDWNPHRVRVEPLVQRVKPGDTLKATLTLDNVLPAKGSAKLVLEGRGQFVDQTFELEVASSGAARREFSIALPRDLPAGRHVYVLRGVDGALAKGADAFLAVDVER